MATKSLLAESPPDLYRSSKPFPRILVFALMLVVLISVSLWSSNFSDEETSMHNYELAKMVSDISKGKAVFVSTFEGPEGLTGFVLKGNTPTGKKVIAWHLEGSEILIFGPVVNKKGQDLTALAAQIQIQGKKNDFGNGIRPQELGSFVFKRGQGSNVRHLYIVVSPSCPTCQKLLQKINDPSVQFKKEVQVSLIPIAHDKQGRAKGARLLETGSFDGHGILSATSIATIEKNTEQLLANTNAKIKTPMLLYEGKIINSFAPFTVSLK